MIRRIWLPVKPLNSSTLVAGPAGPFRPGVGIMGMRERANNLRGILEIKSGQMGSLVKAIIPLASERKKKALDLNVSIGCHP
jgi:signal transduction histidine kinase